MNAVCGKKKNQLALVHRHSLVDSKRAHAWGTYLALPALHEKDCDGKGKCRATDGGLA